MIDSLLLQGVVKKIVQIPEEDVKKYLFRMKLHFDSMAVADLRTYRRRLALILEAVDKALTP